MHSVASNAAITDNYEPIPTYQDTRFHSLHFLNIPTRPFHLYNAGVTIIHASCCVSAAGNDVI